MSVIHKDIFSIEEDVTDCTEFQTCLRVVVVVEMFLAMCPDDGHHGVSDGMVKCLGGWRDKFLYCITERLACNHWAVV